jgi:O-antigen/teichoic acid export membrane protein
MQALEMFSDRGVHASIIQNPRGEDRTFLDTAFTMQAMRGVLLWIATALLAWPVAAFYGQPMITMLLPVAGFNAVLFGLTNVSLPRHARRLALGRLTVLDLVAMTLQITATVVLAWLWPSVWALVLGGFAGSMARLIVSHTILRIDPVRLRLDRDAARELFRFGRWIFISSMLTFFVNRGDVLIIGKFVPPAMLGIFHIGSQFAQVVRQLFLRLANSVLLPVHVRLGAESADSLRGHVRRVRLGVMALMLPPLWFFVLFGTPFIEFLYDDRYQQAGLILQVLAVGGIFSIVPDVGPIALSRGDSFLHMVTLIIRSGLLLAGMVVGAMCAGLWGLITGIVVAAALFYPAQVWICRRYGVWLPMLDLIGFASSGIVIGAGFWIIHLAS